MLILESLSDSAASWAEYLIAWWDTGGKSFNLLEALLESIKAVGSVCTSEAGTNTQEDVVGRAMLQLTSVDQRYTSKISRSTCESAMAAKLSDMHRESEERVKVQVAAEVVNHALYK